MAIDWLSPAFLSEFRFAAIAIGAGLIVERLRPAQTRQSWRGLAFNLATATLFLYLTMLLVPPLSGLVDPWAKRISLAIPVRFPDGVAGSVLQTIAFFVVFDFFFYWWHRAQHRWRWLWIQHRFHHQDRYVNVTTVHRYHFSEEIFRIFVIFVPMAVLFDFKPPTVASVWTAFLLWGYWIHMNLRVGLGPLGRWISGPQFHRFHHTPEYGHVNFAAIFPFWDRLFGTYHHPEPGVFPQATGVANATDGNTFYEGVVLPFVEWGRAIRRGAGGGDGAAGRAAG
ncbi:MAG: sterol desaturase family protein [Burkholderiales bacterium]|nr:sterol desaturase family protein [Burkholderiales bacterium]